MKISNVFLSVPVCFLVFFLGPDAGALPFNLRDQVSKNTQYISKLDQAQYKFINQLTKLQDDINDLEDEINKCKTMINKIQVMFEKSPSNNNKMANDLVNNAYVGNEDNGLFYISSSEGFIWKLDRVSSFWNKTAAQLVSKSFYTDGNYGYKMRLKLDNPFGKLRVMVEILKGAFDNVLPWPFNNEIEVSLLSQTYPYKHYTRNTLYEPDTCLHRSILSYKQYSHIYSMSLGTIQFDNKKNVFEIKCLFNNGKDVNDEKIFNKNIVWKIEKFYEKIKTKDAKIMKYSFYSGDFGYHLQLVIYPHGVQDSGEMNLLLTVLKGHFDDLLWWPFKYNVTVKIFDKNSTINMCPTDPKASYSKRSNFKLAGFVFFKKSEILQSYSSIIKNNQMFVKLKTKSKLSFIINGNSNKKDSKYKEIIWKIDNCSRLIQESLPLTSDVFQMSPMGYNIKMVVYLKGERSVKGKYASLYVYVVNGSYDHILPWPFSKNISLSIINEKNETINDQIQVIENNEFTASLKLSYYHEILVAYSRFMKLTPETMAKNIINDRIIIKLKISN